MPAVQDVIVLFQTTPGLDSGVVAWARYEASKGPIRLRGWAEDGHHRCPDALPGLHQPVPHAAALLWKKRLMALVSTNKKALHLRGFFISDTAVRERSSNCSADLSGVQ